MGAPVGKTSTSFNLIFSLTTGIIKKLLSITINKMEKRDKILMLTKSKLNNIIALLSPALFDMEKSHEEFVMILNERDKYKKNERRT